jgi:hypothetical protein
MASRKPPSQRWESWIDRQIRESQERGEFDDLEGAGRPLADLDQPYDALWWVRKKLKEERLAYLPPTLQIRKDLEVARGEIDRAHTERQVRAIIAEINTRIRHVNRTAIEGPPSTTMPLDEERTVQRWRERRAGEA